MPTSSDADVVKWLDKHCCPSGWLCLRDGRTWSALAYLNGDDDAVKGSKGSAPAARRALAQALGMSLSPCPLPQVGEWEWRELSNGCGWIAKAQGCVLHVCPIVSASFSFDEFKGRVKINGVFVVTRVRESKRGAMRAAERAAQREWSKMR